MRALVQRVSKAAVTIDNTEKAAIASGLLVFIGVEDVDGLEDLIWLSRKIVTLRIFDDKNGVANISVKGIDGDILVVSQFTLHASVKKGNRPSYMKASKPKIAIPLYEKFISQLSEDLGKNIFTGRFGADMKVALVNDGPVTIWIDTKDRN